MATAAAATAATATAVAKGAFSYNRENYMFDQGLRFGRYTTGYSFAMGQAGQYREDIRDLAANTTCKQDTYHCVGAIFFVLSFQLIMAGRLGVHGPSPPGWLLAMYWTNVCSAICYLVTFMWLSLHASARATAGMAHMLTRSVRLPIPSPKQLDKARRTGNSYEKQRMADVFRVPFVAPANKDPEPPIDDDVESARRMPRWYLQDEKNELHGGEGAGSGTNDVPDHFALYQGLQQEWFGHDCYARVGMLYFMSHWLAAANLFQMCHVFTELRCIWPAWACCGMFSTAHYAILNIDIQSSAGAEAGFSLPMEKIVPWMPFLSVLGMTIDYSILDPNPVWLGIIYFLSWVQYIVYILFEIRLFALAIPTREGEQRDVPGRPAGYMPAAFRDMVYIVAPPTHLEPGQSCLQQEMRAGKKSSGGSPKKARDAQFSMFPWKIFRGTIITAIAMWTFIICGRVFEHVNGERQLLKQEGRVMRWPSHVQPWMSPWTRSGDWATRQAWCHAGGCDRRLTQEEAQEHRRVVRVAQRVTGALSSVADLLEIVHPTTTPLPHAVPAMDARAHPITWPEQMRPMVLAAHSAGHVVALDRAHFGAMVHAKGAALGEEALSFKLHGVQHLGEVLGATFHEHGLLLTTQSGALAECAGLPEGGLWQCAEAAGARLPNGGGSLEVAAAARVGKLLRAAVRFVGEPSVVLMEREDHAETWLPAGEIRVPRHAVGRPHLSMAPTGEELHISMGDGGVMKWTLRSQEPEVVAAPRMAAMPGAATWHGLCHMGGGRFAHLASTPGMAPKLLLTQRMM